ncbi:hypothetical protein D1003_08785 [Riemerella anatipestifer]|nr:hypothetical protein [Riemerella anatipestifer]
MIRVYSNKIFNWIILIISVLKLIDIFFPLTQEFEFLNVLILRIILFIISILSVLSFFLKKINKEFYTRLFLLANFILPQIAVYFQFLVEQLFYSFTKTDLISRPIIHLNFLIGLILFFLSLKFSKQSKIQRKNEYGLMIIFYGFFLLILNFTRIFDYDSSEFSVITFCTKILLSISIISVGNKFRIEKMKFKTTIIILLILAIISGML